MLPKHMEKEEFQVAVNEIEFKLQKLEGKFQNQAEKSPVPKSALVASQTQSRE